MKLVIFDKIVIENEIIKAAHGGKFDIFIIKDKEDALNAGSNYIRDVSEKMYNTYIDIHLSGDTTFVEISDNDYIKLKLLHGNGDNIRVERISTSICKPICKLDLLLDNTFSSIVENMIRYSKIYLELLSMENDSREEYRDIIFSHSEIKPVDTVKQRIGNVKCKYIYDEIIKKHLLDFAIDNMVKTESTVSNNYNNKVSTASMNVRALSSYVIGHVVIVLALSYFVKTI